MRLGALVTLVPRIDKRYQGVHQAEIHDDSGRRNWFIPNHPDKDKLLEEMQNKCNEGAHATKLEREGDDKGARQCGRIRVMRIVSERSVRALLARYIPRTPIQHAQRSFLKLRTKKFESR